MRHRGDVDERERGDSTIEVWDSRWDKGGAIRAEFDARVRRRGQHRRGRRPGSREATGVGAPSALKTAVRRRRHYFSGSLPLVRCLHSQAENTAVPAPIGTGIVSAQTTAQEICIGGWTASIALEEDSSETEPNHSTCFARERLRNWPKPMLIWIWPDSNKTQPNPINLKPDPDPTRPNLGHGGLFKS